MSQTAAVFHPENIPAALKALPQWTLWRREARINKEGEPPKITKVLTTPRGTFSNAAVDEPKTWGTYAQAIAALAVAPEQDGLGFIFTSKDPYVVADFDHCFNEKGEVVGPAAEWLPVLNTYTERSQSGNGLHVIAIGSKPSGRCRGPGIEIYEQSRFVAITGDLLSGYSPALEERPEQVLALHEALIPQPLVIIRTPNPQPAGTAIQDDHDLIAAGCRVNPRFEQLWRGDRSHYPSDSEADAAFFFHLVYWTRGNTERVEHLARSSARCRPKWDERRGTSTWLAEEIARAAAIVVYDCPPARNYSTNGYHPAVLGVNGIPKPEEFGRSVVALSTVAGPTALEPEALFGLPGDVVTLLDPHTEAAAAAILASFIISAGCLFGPQPHVYRDGARLTANNFAVLVGPTAAGGKGTATRRTDEILKCISNYNYTKHDIHDMREGEEATSLWSTLQLPGLGSGEALIESLAAGGADTRRMVIEEEFSKPLKIVRREGSILSETLRSAWDGSLLANVTKGRKSVVRAHHVSILGHITNEELTEEMRQTSVFNGFANRFLWISVLRSKDLPFGGGRAAIGPLVKRLHDALMTARTTRGIEFDAATKLLWDQGGLYSALRQRPAGLLGAATSRAQVHVTRLALVWALLDGVTSINVKHLLAALAFWDYAEKSAAYLFGHSSGDDAADIIAEVLVESAPEALSRRQIRDLFQRNAPPGKIPAALARLEALGLAERLEADAEGRGRPAELWRATLKQLAAADPMTPLQRARFLLQKQDGGAC